MILSVCRSIFHYKLMWCKWVVCHPMLQNQPLWFYTDKCAIFLSFFVFTWLVYSRDFLLFVFGIHFCISCSKPCLSSASCSIAMQGVKCHKESIFFSFKKVIDNEEICVCKSDFQGNKGGIYVEDLCTNNYISCKIIIKSNFL